MLVMQGQLDKASAIAASLVNKVQQHWWSRLRAFLFSFDSPYGVQFSMEAYASLALYEAVLGRRRLAQNYLSKADELATSLNVGNEAKLLRAELSIISGDYSEANKLFAEIGDPEDPSRARLTMRLRKRLPQPYGLERVETPKTLPSEVTISSQTVETLLPLSDVSAEMENNEIKGITRDDGGTVGTGTDRRGSPATSKAITKESRERSL